MTAKYKWLPEQPTDEMVNAIMDSWLLSMPENQLRQIYSVLWRTAPEVEQEPSFYRVKLKDSNGVIHIQDCDFPPTAEDYDGEVLSVTPLYTHPQPKQKSLSDEVLTALWSRNTDIACTKHGFIMLSRVIEDAHGIGVE